MHIFFTHTTKHVFSCAFASRQEWNNKSLNLRMSLWTSCADFHSYFFVFTSHNFHISFPLAAVYTIQIPNVAHKHTCSVFMPNAYIVHLYSRYSFTVDAAILQHNDWVELKQRIWCKEWGRERKRVEEAKKKYLRCVRVHVQYACIDVRRHIYMFMSKSMPKMCVFCFLCIRFCVRERRMSIVCDFFMASISVRMCNFSLFFLLLFLSRLSVSFGVMLMLMPHVENIDIFLSRSRFTGMQKAGTCKL